jgi:putative transposase
MVCARDRRDPDRVFRFMSANQANFPIACMARVLGVSKAGYHAWVKRPPSAHARADAALLQRIRTVHASSRQTYGAPRVHAALQATGERHGRKRIARLMRGAGLVGASHRRGGPTTTRRDREARPAPDLVDRNFTAERPNQLWVADITFLPTATGFLYLALGSPWLPPFGTDHRLCR